MFHDICDDLKGRYPKDFKFTGWHPGEAPEEELTLVGVTHGDSPLELRNHVKTGSCFESFSQPKTNENHL